MKYSEFEYICIAITSSLTFIGILVLLIAKINLIRTPLRHIRKDLVCVIFIWQLLIGPLIIAQVWVYTFSDLVDLLTEVVFSISIFVMYMYQKECLTFFTNKYITETPNVLDNLVKDKNHQKIMFEHAHPMHKITGLQRLKLTELYTRYSYLLSGKFVFWICRKRRVKSYKMSRDISIQNNIYLTMYLFSIPIILTIKFILDQTIGLDSINVGRFQLLGFFNLLELVITFTAIPRLTSFSLSFTEVFSFFESNKQLICIVGLRISKKVISSALGGIVPTVSIYNTEESQSILESLIFSLFYLLFWIMTLFRFNHKILNLYEEAPQSVTLRNTVKDKLMLNQNLNAANETCTDM